MARKIFLAVEGVNDGGALGQSISVRANDPDAEGVVQPLVRRILDEPIELVGLKINLLPLDGIDEPAAAMGRRARVASALASSQGCDVLVMHQDVDGPNDGSADDGPSRWRLTVEAVDDGVRVAETQGEGLPAAACVPLVPLRTIESWLLADETAIGGHARPGSDATPAEDPEELWGVPNVRGNGHPKQVLRRAVGGSVERIATRDYRALAEAADLETVALRCPTSFPPFSERLSAA